MNPFMTNQAVDSNEDKLPVIGAVTADAADWFAKQKLGYYAQRAINAKKRVVLQARLAERIANIK